MSNKSHTHKIFVFWPSKKQDTFLTKLRGLQLRFKTDFLMTGKFEQYALRMQFLIGNMTISDEMANIYDRTHAP